MHEVKSLDYYQTVIDIDVKIDHYAYNNENSPGIELPQLTTINICIGTHKCNVLLYQILLC